MLSFDVRSGPTGVLFGSVTTTDIADELWRTRKIRVDRKKIETDSIKRIGRYSIPIHMFEDVTVEVKTLVVPEGGELPPEEELAAMEAAEAEAQAAKEAEAEAHGRGRGDPRGGAGRRGGGAPTPPRPPRRRRSTSPARRDRGGAAEAAAEPAAEAADSDPRPKRDRAAVALSTERSTGLWSAL